MRHFPRTFINGHECEWRGEEWVYVDTGELVDDNPRPCPQCHRPPTTEGYDACLGYIPGVESACCGHGKENGYIIWQKGG